MKKILASAAAAALGLGTAMTLAAPASADDDQTYTIDFTGGLGAYPRSTPQYEARTGDALPEGAAVTGDCWVNGGDITNPYGYTSTVWIRDTSGRYFAEAWLETGGTGAPAGLASCADQDAAETTGESSAPSDAGWQPNCTPGGEYIEGTIEWHPDAGLIKVWRTQAANEAWGQGSGWDATVDMWHDIQACVPGLEGARADSVWQQLECHLELAWTGLGGPSYDLETNTPPLSGDPGTLEYAWNSCLNGNFFEVTSERSGSN